VASSLAMATDERRGPTPRGTPDGREPWRVEGAGPTGGSPGRPRVRWSRFLPYLLIVLGLFALNYWIASRATHVSRPRVPYSPFFLRQVRQGNVIDITSKGTAIQGDLKHEAKYNDQKVIRFKTEVPAFANTDALSLLLQSNGVVINAQPLDTGTPLWETIVFGFGPTLLFIILFVLLIRRAGSASGMLGGFGRSRARRYEAAEGRVTFEDVAGIDEAKAELSEIVDFLKEPQKYARLGGRIPRGVLLSGLPGTGKTLLARAVAGEANVPFFSLSASEFIEAIVGVGASRVRDLFTQAKANAPAIVFIDELDAIGRARGAGGVIGGHDEREQTLNQILTEMDGFDTSTNVIVLAATNRPDVLDPALLRPGRFDRRVAVQPPDLIGRRKILEVHTRSVPLAPEVDLGRVAATTPGMVGADLANLVNEAALLAAHRSHDAVTSEDFAGALEKIILGAERKVMMTPEDRRRTAYHESGHAIVGMLTPGADPVRKVSIIPRGMALGVTFSAPDADRFNYEEHELVARIKVALGGRGAEQIVFDETTTGAESDIQQVTEIARHMVGRWGMSTAIGPIAALPSDGRGPLYPGTQEQSEHTRRLVDEEVRRLVERAYGEVVELLQEHRPRLDGLAEALLAHETLDEEDAYAAAGIERRAEAEVAPA
jgi:cell division protease FtsH